AGLAAAEDHRVLPGEGGGGQRQGGRPVVDDQGVLGLGAGGEQRGAGAGAAPRADAGSEVEFDVGVAGGVLQRRARRRRQRRPAQVRVHDDPGRGEDRSQGGGG